MYAKAKLLGHPLHPMLVSFPTATHHVGIDLTPEQQRYEPRASPRREREEPLGPASHGQPLC